MPAQSADAPKQTTKDPSPAQRISGIVVDPAGASAAGCEVWLVLVRWENRTADAIDQATTHAQGRFAFRVTEPESSRVRPGGVAYSASDVLS